jgi:uncharacterized membrane protein YgdD (TMEM256/DUF423 family)
MNNLARWFLGVTGFMGATAVMAGAFAAHGIQNMVQSPYLIQVFQTAVLYQMFHTLALLGISVLLLLGKPSRTLKVAGLLIVVGTILFSGSLYLLALASWRVGMVTPIGGVLLIAAWVSLLVSAIKPKL